MHTSVATLSAVLALVLGIITHAQSPTPLAVFEVVSIRELSEPVFSVAFQPGGRFVMRGPTSLLLSQAYGRITRFVNGPPWLTTEGYEIMAVAAREPTLEERTTLLKGLLADRFKLVAHMEDRDTPAFELVQKAAGKLGPMLRKSNTDCDAYFLAVKNGAPPELPKASNGQFGCRSDVIRASADDNSILSGGMTMAQLAFELRGSTEPPLIIVDRTELQGYYELTLRYRREQTRVEPYSGPVAEIQHALEDDLGLKLQRAIVREPAMVIEHIERPSAN